jgi:hypothetical protein
MVRHGPPGDSADKRQPAAAVGQPATVVLIYGSRAKGVKGANGGWTRFKGAPSAAPGAHSAKSSPRTFRRPMISKGCPGSPATFGSGPIVRSP